MLVDESDSAVQENQPTLTSQGTEEGPGDEQQDGRTCRICFCDGDDEDGRLIAPCRCSGTARYVHQGCLRSWREADRKNSFYACTQCGQKYRFRSSGSAKFLNHRFAPRAICAVLLLVFGFLASWPADAAMRYTERDLLLPRDLLSYSLINHRALGDGLREFSSTAGTLAGDCSWSSALEEHWIIKNETYHDGKGWMIVQHPTRRNLTTCGRLWNAEADEQVRAGTFLTVVLRTLRGIAFVGLLEAFVGNAHRFYIGLNLGIRMYCPRWMPRPDVPNIRYVPPLLVAFCMDALTWIRLPLKRARRDDRLFAPLQLLAVLVTAISIGFAGHLAFVSAKWLVKKGLSRIEDLVLDLEPDDSKRRGITREKVE